jgi:hypothetical protein
MEDVQEYMNSVNEAFGADTIAENVMSRLMESKEAVVAPISTIGTLLAVKAGSALIGKLAAGAKGVAQNVVKNASNQIQQKAGQIGQNIKSTIQQKAGQQATEEEPETEVPEESTEMTDMTGEPLEEGEMTQEEALNMLNNVPRPDMSDPSLYPEGAGAPEGGAPAEAGEAGEAVQATQTVAREDLPFPDVEPEVAETGGFTEPEAMPGTSSNILGRVIQGQQQAQQAQQAQQEAEAPEEAEEGDIDEDLAQQLIRTGFTQTVEQTGGVGALAPEQLSGVGEAIGTTSETLAGAGSEAVGQLAGVASQAVSSLTGAVGSATGAATGAVGDAVTTGVGAVTDAVTEGIGATIGSALGSAASVLGPIGLIAGIGALIPMFMEMGHHGQPPLLNPSTQFI